LRAARRQLLDAGTLSPGLLAPALQASWQRSLGFGLSPEGRPTGAPHASGAQLARALEHRRALVAQARPVMAFLAEQIRDSGSLVVLADPQGMLLHALGDDGFAGKAARVALRPGAIWHEQWRGTNAIGTALAEGAPVVIHGAEHFLARNAFLTCAAAPIIDPAGQLLGALDISGDQRSPHHHTLGLVRSAARMIEHQLFEVRHGSGLCLRLHTQPEGLGTVTEGLLALSEDGWIIGANSIALDWLGLPRQAVGGRLAESVLGCAWEALLAAGAGAGRVARPQLHRLPGSGTPLWLRLDVGRGAHPQPRRQPGDLREAPPAALPADALAALDGGDPGLQRVIERARRVVGKPIALLLQGESGVGKELFAQACHRSGPRRKASFIAVNCAALPEPLIEAELFGYRPGAFTGASRDGAPGRIREADGGTLFLDEIGDMPPGLQARLLRVLQERQVQPLGGGRPVAVDFQLICASHRHLRAEVDAGRFREDLYYRVNGLLLSLPPLRERQDLPTLVERMLAEFAPPHPPTLAPELVARLAAYRWPGNLRQLANVLRTACALRAEGEAEIGWEHLPEDLADELRATRSPSARAHPEAEADLRQQARRSVALTVEACQGNLSEAARQLGISRNTLYRKLRAQAAA
jgi:transcriptional regulator of acetoin/glycerol metabolism